jgi:hypothetical protein
MASRLYPGFGSGKGTFEAQFKLTSMAAYGAPPCQLFRRIFRGKVVAAVDVGAVGYNQTLSCGRSFLRLLSGLPGRGDLECGDKIFLPQVRALAELMRVS